MKKMGKCGGKKALYFSAGRGSGNRGPRGAQVCGGPRYSGVKQFGRAGLLVIFSCWRVQNCGPYRAQSGLSVVRGKPGD